MARIDRRDGTSPKERLQRGETLVGCFQRIPAPEITEVCAYAGFDLVVVDMEHTLVSEARVADLIRAAEAVGIAALVRVPSHDPATIGRVLEAGPAGVQIPRVQSAAEAAAAVRATRYAPRGVRGLSTSRQAGYGARMSLEEYVGASEQALLVVVQVEDRSGLEEVEGIASVEGVDAVFIGLTDLSQDLGVPGRYDDPALRRAVEGAFRAVKGQGRAAAVPVTGAAMAKEYLELGATYLTTNDIRLLLNSSRAFLAGLRGNA